MSRAAEELERLHQPCMYRVHAPPSDEKLEALRGFLRGFDITLPPGNQIHPRDLDRVLKRVAGTEEAAAGQRGDAAQPVAGRVQPRQYRPFRPGPAALRAFHQPDPPLRRPAGASRADPRPEARRRRARRRGGRALRRTPPSTSPPPNAARRWPSATRSTATWRPSWPTRWARAFAARISGVTRFGLFVTVAGQRRQRAGAGVLPARRFLDARRGGQTPDRPAHRL